MIYLDYQATTPLAPEALRAMLPWLEQGHANPHSAHRAGRQARAAVEVARDQVAALLPPGGRVVFTSGATEALNWAIKGVGMDAGKSAGGGIVTTAIEHAAVLDTAHATGRPLTILPVDSDGLIAPETVREGTGLVAAMLVNNEIGTVQPVAALARAAHLAGAWMLCDAVQGYGRIAIPDDVDLVALSAHKIHGPKGIGALWIRDGITLPPLLHGGDQEGGRSGTLSPALCAGFGAAAKLMAARQDADSAHVAHLWALAIERLGPGWTINGSTERRYHGNLNIRRDGLDVARLMSDCRDIAFSAGSACASGSGRPSHVLTALGLTDAQVKSSIRLGFGRCTTEAELTQGIDQLVDAAGAQRR
ncbi:cysteine desulfurase family protein [Sphingomonadaceae bacterium jetA1]|jgi:cysteine desulfurase|uniref:cysteine desulfurase family protein n=1 Tax=Facivitalis istanbulensis TaxID=3075838 RepID=UPI00349879AF